MSKNYHVTLGESYSTVLRMSHETLKSLVLLLSQIQAVNIRPRSEFPLQMGENAKGHFIVEHDLHVEIYSAPEHNDELIFKQDLEEFRENERQLEIVKELRDLLRCNMNHYGLLDFQAKHDLSLEKLNFYVERWDLIIPLTSFDGSPMGDYWRSIQKAPVTPPEPIDPRTPQGFNLSTDKQ